MNKTILIASSNQNKIKEFKKYSRLSFYFIKRYKWFWRYRWRRETFEANSYLKAKHYFDKHKIPTLADDSGLEIEVLNNEPEFYQNDIVV